MARKPTEGETMMYELFYASGGHGGPYPTLVKAVQTALIYATRQHERYVDIREYTKNGYEQVWRIPGKD